jgi:hypothetical protein
LAKRFYFELLYSPLSPPEHQLVTFEGNTRHSIERFSGCQQKGFEAPSRMKPHCEHVLDAVCLPSLEVPRYILEPQT